VANFGVFWHPTGGTEENFGRCAGRQRFRSFIQPANVYCGH